MFRSDFYVDHLLSGTSNIEDAIKVAKKYLCFKTAGFTLRKWATKYSTFLDNIPRELQEIQQMLSLDNKNEVTTLKLLRNLKTDQLQVKSNTAKVPITDFKAITKWWVLASIASIFDPLKLLSPAIITYKIFLQKLWQVRIQCDEVNPSHLQQEWNQLFQTIPEPSQPKLKQKVICSNAINIQLHEFCDGKERAYGACSILAQQTGTRHLVNFCVPHARWHHWNN